MYFPNTLTLITTLVDARDAGDIDAVLACYEPDATIVTQSGDILSGMQGARTAAENFIALKPELIVDHRKIIEGETVSLHLMRWRLRGTAPDGTVLEASGCTADVCRKQADGGWLLAIDNPWGTDVT
ncbi:DUF4440 domain-containing protein [Streptomyces sp. GbtcB6]|uniref:YybH family protein n=1 Tax=Streptomyces sp. GbtcB6 TaxID=2824751 RepID=UPI001C30E912|nr:DUF4440 domain-containing protein [Streptomyces sp. GbtcB6]